MSKKRILLASLLKPVTDTRMFEKIGLSLCKLDNVQVHIAGFSSAVHQNLPDNLQLHPIFNFNRLSFARVKAQLHYWKLLVVVKPDLIIVSTHELLLVSVLYKKLFKCTVLYDVQENYSLNLITQKNYGAGLRYVFARGVKLTESLTAEAISHFLLAEHSYAQELPFIADRYTILENKFNPIHPIYIPAVPVQLNPDRIKLLYTGTIATLYGIFEAVTLTEKFYQFNPGVSLTIMGYCADKETLTTLKSMISDKPYINLIGGDRLVPHTQIVNEIKKSDLGLLPYHVHKSTFNCIPTKLYEYVALGLPILIQNNPKWEQLIKSYQAGLSIDFKNIEINSLVPAVLNHTFYVNGIPGEVFWNSEEKKLTAIVQQYL